MVMLLGGKSAKGYGPAASKGFASTARAGKASSGPYARPAVAGKASYSANSSYDDKPADEPRMVYVANLPFQAEWQELKDFMKQAGTVEFASIMTDAGADAGRSRGIGYVRYSTEEEAQYAVESLNGAEFDGRVISVDAWKGGKPRSDGKGDGKGGMQTAYRSSSQGASEGFSRGSAKGKAPYGGFSGWVYIEPGQLSAPWRQHSASKGSSASGFAKSSGKGFKAGGKALDRYSFSSAKVHGDQSQMVYVGNLPFEAEWQELKDHMKQAGNVEFVSTRGSSGQVRYSTAEEAQAAIETLNGSDLMGRSIVVDAWTTKGPRDSE